MRKSKILKTTALLTPIAMLWGIFYFMELINWSQYSWWQPPLVITVMIVEILACSLAFFFVTDDA